MIKFLGVLMVILSPLLIAALVIGRKLEENEVRSERDRAIRDGFQALKYRIMNLEKLRRTRRERRG
jgi:Tfp pilus assembly protein PilO